MSSAPFVREAGSGPGVVCVHSNASSSGQWRGLMDLLGNDGSRHPAPMAAALHDLPHRPVACTATRERMLTGLDRVAELAEPWLRHRRPPRPRLVSSVA